METFKKYFLRFIKNGRMILAKFFVLLAFAFSLSSMYIHAGPTWTWIPSIFYVLIAIFFVLCEIVFRLNPKD